MQELLKNYEALKKELKLKKKSFDYNKIKDKQRVSIKLVRKIKV